MFRLEKTRNKTLKWRGNLPPVSITCTKKYSRNQNHYTFDGKDMIKVPGLDGSGKMGKSEGNAINLYEDPKGNPEKSDAGRNRFGPN
jgi:hypothetical protein